MTLPTTRPPDQGTRNTEGQEVSMEVHEVTTRDLALDLEDGKPLYCLHSPSARTEETHYNHENTSTTEGSVPSLLRVEKEGFVNLKKDVDDVLLVSKGVTPSNPESNISVDLSFHPWNRVSPPLDWSSRKKTSFSPLGQFYSLRRSGNGVRPTTL